MPEEAKAGLPRIYLDHHATTPLDPRVLDAMAPYWGRHFGNPHARQNARGWRAAAALDEARQTIARVIGANASEIVFTSGATEANALAIVGLCGHAGSATPIVTSAIEHPSVLANVQALATAGVAVILPVGADGRLDAAAVARSLRPETGLATIQFANHEVGTVQPIAEIAQACRAHGVALHVDAAQALGKLPLAVDDLGADLVSLSAHKLYGPMGIGALYVRRGVELAPIIRGGGQEGGLRSGTVPLPLAVGFAEACRIVAEDLEGEANRLGRLRDRLWASLESGIPGLRVNGSDTHRLPGNLNLTVPEVRAEDLMLSLPELALSSGAACASVRPEPSPVLAALGLTPEEADRSLRFSLGRFTTEVEIEEAAELIIAAWRRLRSI